MPANRALLPAASQPSPCGRAMRLSAGSTCGAVVEIVIVAVAPLPPTVTEVGLIEQLICALARPAGT